MSTWIKVARYHLVQPLYYLGLPWAVLAFSFAVTLTIFVVFGGAKSAHPGSLVGIYAVFFALGLLSIVRSLPFGLALGVSRRSYYAGTVLLAITLAAVDGLALAVLQVAERATGGWGEDVQFFRVVWILDGPWYLTWVTSFVVLALLFVYGMWFGLVYRRWNEIGLLTFIAVQVTVLLAGALVTTWAGAWPSIGHFFADLSAAGLTSVLAGLAVALLAGGYATIRRMTV
jgi:hypothetical protein